MKKWLQIISAVMTIIIVIVVLVYAGEQEAKAIVDVPDISIHVDGENAFLTENELKQRLSVNRMTFQGQRNDQLNIAKIENDIASMAEVKQVKVYKDLGGKWFVQVELRKPIARIFNTGGDNFYLDQDGFLMKKSGDHTARVLVFSGFIKDAYTRKSVRDIINNDTLKSIQKIDDIYRISNYVCNDPLLQKLIGQVYLEKNGDFVMIPLVGDQKIIFGTAYTEEEVKGKFERLKVFYHEAMPYEGWTKYSEISVKYEGQIVCRKRRE